MPEVIVLREGYSIAEPSGAGMRAGCSISLVLGDGVRAIVDPGGPHERDLVASALGHHGLVPADIQLVICTHGHIDHVGNAGLFAGATFITGSDRSRGDGFSDLDFGATALGVANGVEVLATPGHTSEDLSVLVQTRGGLVAIAGDVFENGDPADQTWRRYSRNPRQQTRSRRTLLEVAQLIVPGHGPAFAARALQRRS